MKGKATLFSVKLDLQDGTTPRQWAALPLMVLQFEDRDYADVLITRCGWGQSPQEGSRYFFVFGLDGGLQRARGYASQVGSAHRWDVLGKGIGPRVPWCAVLYWLDGFLNDHTAMELPDRVEVTVTPQDVEKWTA